MASKPSGGFLPVRRKLGAPRRRAERGSVDLVVVLVDCTGCRSRREAPGPSQLQSAPQGYPAGTALGLAYRRRALARARRRKGVRSRLAAAKSRARWRAVDDPAPPGRRESDGSEGARAREVEAKAEAAAAGERALVEGRRPGVGEAVVFDEMAVELVSGGFRPEGSAERPDWLGRGRDAGRQRLRHKLGSWLKTPQSGGAVREERSIEAPLGPHGITSTTAIGAT